MSVWVVVGGQFGSEGKGKISAIITLQESIDICIRCGGPNSGHSFQRADGSMLLVRQVPTGFVRPNTRLLIPAGGLIDLDVLKREISELCLDPHRLGIDRNAMIISAEDRKTESALNLSERLSSTLCGVGSAVARRALRTEDVELASQAAERLPWLKPYITTTSDEANLGVDQGKKILIEGTQGSGLSLYHSNHYPKTTSRDTNASGFLSEVGLSPLLVTEIVLVFRTFPIRVAGLQAGPMLEEITWDELGREANCPDPIREFTTVSRKLRRIARFDWAAAKQAIKLNRPTRIALNFTDYLGVENKTARSVSELNERGLDFINALWAYGVPVSYVGTGPSLRDNICVPEVSSEYSAPGPATNLGSAHV